MNCSNLSSRPTRPDFELFQILDRSASKGAASHGDAENAGMESKGSNFTRVEKAGPPSTGREMDKYKCIMYRQIRTHFSQAEKNCLAY